MSSRMIDDETREIVEGGRATLGEFVVALRNEFRKVFLVFAVGMIGTIIAMQYYVWEILRGVTEARMAPETTQQYDILVRTPFDVILLQVKIGLAVGIILALPVLLYYSREGLERRGVLPNLDVARWKVLAVFPLSIGLFGAGAAYAYYVFFPVMFDFLTTYTLNVGFSPEYDIVMWTEFIILLTASFGLAGQLPLVMSALAYLEVVPYETFRDKWRYAVLGIFVFGAFFSPPDPFTQIMWAVPLLVLYGVSLYFAKFVTAIRRGGSTQVREKLTSNWSRVATTYVLSSAAVYIMIERAYVDAINAILRQAPPDYRYEIVLTGLPLSGPRLSIALGLIWGAVITFPVVIYYAWPELEPPDPGPAELDLEEMSTAAVRAAPASLFADMSEPEALSHAQQAMDEDDPEKARAILDRHDEATEVEEVEGPRRPEDMAERPTPPDDIPAEPGPPEDVPEGPRRPDELPDHDSLWSERDVAEMSPADVGAASAALFAGLPRGKLEELRKRAMENGEPETAKALRARYREVNEADASGSPPRPDDAAERPTSPDEGPEPRRRPDPHRPGEKPDEPPHPEDLPDDVEPPEEPPGDYEPAEDLDGPPRPPNAPRPDNMAEDLGTPSNPVDTAQQRAAGFVDAFTEEETTEDDIGGYYYDLRFILESLTSKMFRIVAIFMASVGIVFYALYQGGIGTIKRDFLSRLPPQVVEEGVDIVALHPVETILFEVKMSVIAGVVTTLPIVVYYAWPAIEERLHGLTREFETDPPVAAIVAHWNQVAGAFVLGAGATYYALANELVAVPGSLEVGGLAVSGTQLGYVAVAAAGLAPATLVGSYHAGASVRERIDHGGKQNVFLLWLVTLTTGVVVGSLLGYFFVAPTIITYLVEDALRADMILSYRINNFFWLIFATTVGIGLLADVPMTMWLFHRGDIVPFETMRERWREVVVAIFGLSALLTPSSLLSMFLMAFPVAVAYLIGLGGLWVVTLPWRVRNRVGALLGG